MPLHNVENLSNLIQDQDLEGLGRLALPVARVQNHSLSFRSCLMLSTHNLKHLAKIPFLNAECIILNLEDGVSVEQKPYALRLCAMALAANPKLDKKLVVRINALHEGGIDEIAYLNAFMPDAIRIPKIRTIGDVQQALDLIDENIEIHLSIETKEAWLALNTLACHPRVKAYYLGVLDLFADLGLSQSLLTPENPTVHYMLSHFMMTTRSCGVKPVSFVYQDYKNSDGLRNWLELEHLIGLDAKGCITPDQVTLIHEVFGISESEIEKYRTIVELFEKNAANGITGFVDERYGFIDEPIYKGALVVLKGLL
ncbi:MAG TPA: aldolase/citrate lyase family protein [Sulfuricurvum sp.]|nr:aldolase/citrate lyase family protein [Sulfuricurvum sp.]